MPQIAEEICPMLDHHKNKDYNGTVMTMAKDWERWAMRIRHLSQVFPITRSSKKYHVAYNDYITERQRCPNGYEHWAAETYCSNCAVVEKQLEEQWEKDTKGEL